MKRLALSTLIVSLGLLLSSCDSFVEEDPQGTLAEEQLNAPDRVERLVIAAYSSLGNSHWRASTYNSPWPYGSVRSDNAYKGGGGTSDQGEYDQYERFAFVQPDQDKGNRMWERLYVGISRANLALDKLNQLSEGEFPLKTTRQAEMRFIRGHYHFMGKILFKHVPFITEDIPEDELNTISNRQFTSQELWDQIAADFQFAADNLPESQSEVGRADKFAATAYLAKTRLYQAYEQDDQHNVTNVNQDRLNDVVNLVDEVIASGTYELFDDIRQNFLWGFENGREGVFEVQMSVNDGTAEGRVDMEQGLNFTMNPGFGCCWFHIPSQNLVNAFQTDENGFPKFDTFNDNVLIDPEDFQNNTVDPRIDHTVSIDTHPFKYDPTLIYEADVWARTPEVYGPFSSMKALQHPDCPCMTAVGPFFASSKNPVVIRYADVLLWKAEALIELGRHNEALPIINQIRERAKNSEVKDANGDNVSNYNIEPYSGANWTQDFARQALRWERRLELATEGWRFFDLVRWGIAAETLNEYFEVEKTRHDYLQDAFFQENRDEYLPIPEQQIDFSEGVYQQNTGWPGAAGN